MKHLFYIFILALAFASQPLKAQYNPYLDKKAKNKPSAVMARENRRELKKQKRVAKKQMRRSKRKTGRKRR